MAIGPMTSLTTVADPLTARILVAHLGAAGVTWELRGSHDGPYPLGPVEILVARDDLDLARALLAEDGAADAVAAEATAAEAAAAEAAPFDQAVGSAVDAPHPGGLEGPADGLTRPAAPWGADVPGRAATARWIAVGLVAILALVIVGRILAAL